MEMAMLDKGKSLDKKTREDIEKVVLKIQKSKFERKVLQELREIKRLVKALNEQLEKKYSQREKGQGRDIPQA